ncbi:pyridine nucleotide-disulfide oxidoreductase [Deinococcus aetherius]|uniref:Pyridine nucleotide-disulfide oxidoreductase n=1 Tax=Deinococcus aetherius TaxID=200252 RepID=A0ABM8ADG9_9DEIO|nr:NAD(P)/FAD-dependent oxidoreductase [Deinococcus aetherius]BDP41827.1 pyridine nucleotide-disulfide oxidoreductase [Deinococcus aetherius]
METFDVIVVGAGAAGVNAALVLGRARRKVLLLDGGPPRNAPAGEAHGLLTRDGIRPLDLKARALADLAPYPVTVRAGVAREARRLPEGFAVRHDGGWALGRRLLLASGVRDVLPPVAGLRERWGHLVHHCPYCDGWEHRGRPLGVLGVGDAGHHLALNMRAWSEWVTLFTDGPDGLTGVQRRDLARLGVGVVTAPLARLTGRDRLCLHLRSRETRLLHALFLSPEQTPGSTLPASLDCALNARGRVIVDERGETSVPGIFAAGDLVGAPQYVVNAAASGMTAAVGINTALIHEEVEALGAAFHKHRSSV